MSTPVLDLDLQVPDDAWGGEVLAASLVVRNSGTGPAKEITVLGWNLPGSVVIDVSPAEMAELDEIVSQRDRVVTELEYQIRLAFMADQPPMTLAASVWRALKVAFGVVRDGIAVSAVVSRGALSISTNSGLGLDGVPAHAQEALRVRTLDDLVDLEERFVASNQRISASLRNAFAVNKRKLKAITDELAKRNTPTSSPEALTSVVSLGPGQSCIFPIRFRAPIRWTPRTIPVHASVTWSDGGGEPYSLVARAKLPLRATPALQVLVALGGGPIGYLAREALSAGGLQSASAASAAGCAVLSLAALALTIKSDKRFVPVAVDDVAGALVVALLCGISWESLLAWLGSLGPSA